MSLERNSYSRSAWPRGARGLGVLLIASLLSMGIAVAATTTKIRTNNNQVFGRILEGPRGFTLYVYCEWQHTSPVCSGRSSSKWPPLIAHGKVVAATGSKLNANKLGTRKLSNGQRQVTYYQQPLYLYEGDRKPGQVKGETCSSVIEQSNGAWFVISSNGHAITPPC